MNGLVKKRRLFVAIKISETLQEEILTWREFLLSQPEFSDLPANVIRWLEGKNLHITLIPPWYESDIKYQKSKI